MSKFILIAGVAMMFLAASGKVIVQGIRLAKLRRAGMTSAQTALFKGPFDSAMSRREASLILGVKEVASEMQVMNAYKRLMMVNHPDTGGSTYVASKINEAKDKMLMK